MALILRPAESTETLPEKLVELGRLRRLVAVAAGLFTLAGVVLFTVALACVLDACFHLSPLARGIALVSILTAAVILLVRGILRPAALPATALEVALELENCYPALNDALASAVTFLTEQAEAPGVSNRLQRVAVRSATRLADRHQFGRLIPGKACWRAGWLCAIVAAAMIPLVLMDVNRSAMALVRLGDPFGNHPWPTQTRIELLIPGEFPARIPRGERFELKFVVSGVIREHAYAEYQLATGEVFQEQYPLSDGADGRTSAVVYDRVDPGRLPVSFSFHVYSNDGDTGWQHVKVVPPPKLIDLNGRPSPQFTIIPPSYTGLPTINLPDGAGVLEVPVGTIVRMQAAVDVPVSSAEFAYLGDKSAFDTVSPLAALGHLNPLAAALCPLAARSITSDIPLSVDAGGRVISGNFIPSMDGKYSLRFYDETGLPGSRLIEFRLLRDPAPVVSLPRPAAGKDPAIYTPDALIPVHVIAEDHVFAVRSVFLEYRVGQDGMTRTIPVSDVRGAARAFPAIVGGPGALAWIRPVSAEAEFFLPAAALRRDDGSPVRDGDTVFLRGAADDWDDVSVWKKPGHSGEVEITIATAEGIESWLQKELTALRPELVRLRDQEREVRQKTGDVVPSADGSLTPMQRDQLLGAEQQQRQIRGKVNDPRDGLRARADLLRETARSNRLPPSNTTNRVELAADELGRIADRDLTPIEANLGDARQIAGQPVRPGRETVVVDHLKKALRHEKAIDESLANLLDLLAIWGSAAEIRGEARILRDQLMRQLQEAARIGEKIPTGRTFDSLLAGQKAELERAAGKAELGAEQAASILTRAARLAAEKDRLAAELKQTASKKANQAADVLAGAERLPPGSPERSTLNAQANTLKLQSEEMKTVSEKAAAEAVALRKAIEAASGQDLPDDVRNAAQAFKNNQQIVGKEELQRGADRLGKLVDALMEKAPDAAPDLAKAKKLADELNELGDAQDGLRKQAADAVRLADPARREAELKKLAVEQDKLIEQGKELLQRLVRERSDAAANDTRRAIDQMENARDDLESGKSGARSQDQAVDRLDSARDRLDAVSAAPEEHLSDEKRRKMVDVIKALAERQKAAGVEADRILGMVASNKKWERSILSSYADLEERERALAGEVRQLGEKEFARFLVLARLLTEAATAMETAGKNAQEHREDAGRILDGEVAFEADLEAANRRKVERPMALAARRLEQLLAALKEEPPKKKSQPGQPPAAKPPQGGGGNGGDPDIIPPLAQLKVLKALQAEIVERTAEFAKEHPDADKLTDDERTELKELEQAQRDIASLFEEMSKLFQERQPEPAEKKTPEKSP